MLRSALLLVIAAALCVPAAAQKRPESDSLRALRAEQLFVRGMTRAYVGDHEAAIRQYEQALEIRPGEAAVLAALAEAHQAEGASATALYFASLAAEAAPAEPSVYRQLAGLQLEAGEADAAIQTYQRLVALAPDDADALVALARVQQQSGRLEESLATYSLVLERVGESEAVRTQMLGVYERLGDAAGIVRALEALVALDPANAALRRRLADRYRAQGDTAQADALAPPLDEPQQGDDDADLFRLGERLFDEGDWAGAAEALARALAENPLNPPAWARLVTALARAGNTDAALDAADEATLLFPGQLDLVRAAAFAHAEAGHHREAVGLFEEALDLLEEEDPANDTERSVLLDLLNRQRERLGQKTGSGAP